MNREPNLREKIGILLNDCEMFGARMSVRHAAAWLLAHQRDDFDQRCGVTTDGIIAPSRSEIEDPTAFENALNYEPTREAVMRHILRHVRRHLEPRTLTFVDLGCGKGRALLLAAELPFIDVIGVEICASHCRVAEHNVASYRPSGEKRRSSATSAKEPQPSRNKITVHQGDVTRFEFPQTDLLVYLYNPFRGHVFRTVLDRLAAFQARTRRRVHVVLSGPRNDKLLRAHAAYYKLHECQVINVNESWNLWQCRAPAASSANGRLFSAGDSPSWSGSLVAEGEA